MTAKPTTPEDYLAQLPPARSDLVSSIREVVSANTPAGVEEGMQYGMIGWFVPHSIYELGYHTDKTQPVPFAGLASQRQKVSLYLFCSYVQPELGERFARDYAAWLGKKTDMGKSCIRFKSQRDVPYDLLAALLRETSLDAFLTHYDASRPARYGRKWSS